tara:strand:+ start:188 stop:868 length:681 start_codon:yes stop_codon:yes gene_type:complete
MYRDLGNIKIKPIKSKDPTKEIEKYLSKIKDKKKIIKIGFKNYHKIYSNLKKKYNMATYDMVFYKQMSQNYKNRFTNCYWKRNIKEEDRVYKKLVKNPKKKYIFLHDEPSLNYIIDESFFSKGYEVIKNDKSEILFNLGKVIENASELHLMESSIRNMAETLKLKSKNNFLYIWRRKSMAPRYDYKIKKITGSRIKWKIIFTNPKNGKNIFFYLSELINKFKFRYL